MNSISRPSNNNNYEVTTELTWENGQLSMQGLRGININPPQPKQPWVNNKPGDSTLESLVHQATTFTTNNNNFNATNKYSTPLMPTNNITSSSEKWGLHENPISNMHMDHINNPECSFSSMAESSGAANWREKYSSSHMQVVEQQNPVEVQNSMPMVPPRGRCSSASVLSKRVRSEATGRYCNVNGCDQEGEGERGTMSEPSASACASASAALCGDGDTAMMMTWASFESPPRSFKTARNTDDDSACHDCSENQEGERMTKGESFRSHSSARRSRAAAIHNQSERRRRDRINEKMKALQRLVPNASKTDKASMLDEVIEYLKQLQAQVQVMSNARNMPQMVMPLGMQQQLQMSLLARMGMGMGMGLGMGMTPMGMIDVNNLARNSLPPLIHAAASLGGSAPSFVPPPFAMQMPMPIPNPAQLKPNANATTMNSSTVPNFNEAYNTLLAQQSMNMDFFNKMAALYRQQSNLQASKKPANLSLPSDGQ